MPTLAEAIAQLENTNPVYNNPGAISGVGDTGQSFGQGIGIYSSLEAGQTALQNQLDKIYSGESAIYNPSMTLKEFGSHYAPYDSEYGAKIASIMGVDPNTSLIELQSNVRSNGNPFTAIKSAVTSNWFTTHLEDIATIIVGLILIGAGVMAFKQTQTVIETTTKAAKGAISLIP